MSKEIMKPEPHKVDGNTGQIVEVHPTTEEVVAQVKSFLDGKEKKIMFNGKRYAEYDDFQYIGTFYGITVKTFDPHFVEIGGRKGFHAKAMLLRDQMEIGRAEAFCMDDEPNWRSKPLFQLASMAQTRAAAKAYSNLFRPIVRMAGLEGSPAEEMDHDYSQAPVKIAAKEDPKIKALGQKIINAPKEDEFGVDLTNEEIMEGEEDISEALAARAAPDELEHIKDEIPFPDPPAANVKPVSEKQAGLIIYRCKLAKLPDTTLRAYMKEHWGVSEIRKLPWQAMDPILKWIDSFSALGKK